jgi:Fe-S-cluster containining protein
MNRKKRQKIERKLEEFYKSLPTVNCKGLCQESCGPIAMTEFEYDRLMEKAKNPLTISDDDGTCSMLKDGRCSVYEVRPLICRLWGLTKEMECPHGCVPTRWISRAEGFELLTKAHELTESYRNKASLPELERVLNG